MDIIDRIAAFTGTAVIYEGATRTERSFAELLALAAENGRKLPPAGERVLVAYPQGMGFVDAFWACLAAGVVAVPVQAPDSRRAGTALERWKAIVDDCDPVLILTSDDRIDDVPDLGVAVRSLKQLTGDRELGPRPPLAWLQYTSGSTGRPKGARVTQDSLMANLEAFSVDMGITSDSVFVSWLPTFHDLGVVFGMMLPLFHGVRTVMMDPVDFVREPARFLSLMDSEGGTHTAGPDFGYALMARKTSPEQRAAWDLSRWKVALNGAEPIRRDSELAFEDAFQASGLSETTVLHAYGMSETTAVITAERFDRRRRFLQLNRKALSEGRAVDGDGPWVACVGRPASSMEVVIVDGELRGENQVGEVWVRGPSVTDGAWSGSKDYDAQLDGERYFSTGDQGFMRNGDLYITGRLKELIIVRGEKHHPYPLEEAVANLDRVVRPGSVAVVPFDGGVGVALELRGEPPSDLRGRIAGVFSDVGLAARAITFLKPGELPKTLSGKIRRADVPDVLVVEQAEAQLAEGELGIILAEVARLTGAPQVSADRPWRELGLDSIELIDLGQQLTRKLGRLVKDTDFFRATTPRALAQDDEGDLDDLEAELLAELEGLEDDLS